MPVRQLIVLLVGFVLLEELLVLVVKAIMAVVLVVALVVTAVVPPHLDLLISLADLAKIPSLLTTTSSPKSGEALVQVLGRLEVGKGSSSSGVHGHVRVFVADAAADTNTTNATAVCAHVAVPPVRNEEAGQVGKGQKAEDRTGQSTALPVPVLDPVSAVRVAPRSAARSASRHPRHRHHPRHADTDAPALLLLLRLREIIRREEAICITEKEGSDCRRSSYYYARGMQQACSHRG